MATRRSSRIEGPGFRRILWPTDFSPLAKAALPHALALAAAGEAELIVLHVLTPIAVYAPPPLSGPAWARMDKEVREAAREQLHQAVEDIRAAGRAIRVRSLLVGGSPFAQIPRTAKRLRCDLVVLATHGRTGLRHLFLGSVAENVVRRAPCPVLTVRPLGAGKRVDSRKAPQKPRRRHG
jgi:universal stress protein A